MFKCCGCDLLFSTQQAVKTHISLKIKINKGELVLGKLASEGPAGAGGRLGVGPGRGRPGAGLEDRYFHKGLHNLSWPGPGYMMVNLGLAAAAAGRGGGGSDSSESGGSGCPGQLAGGAATLLRLEYSETDPSSDSESESWADQDPPELDPASESET